MALMTPHFSFMSPSIFESATSYFAPQHAVNVDTGYDIIPIKQKAVTKMLPRLSPTHYHHHHFGAGPVIDLRSQAKHLSHSLRNNLESTLDILRSVFEDLRASNGAPEAFKAYVCQSLQIKLNGDIEMLYQGLKESRRAFVTLAAFAKRTGSRVLASALANFFIQHAVPILNYERPRFFPQWGLALWDVRKFITPTDAQVCFLHLCERLHDFEKGFAISHYRDGRFPRLLHALESLLSGHPQGGSVCEFCSGIEMDGYECDCRRAMYPQPLPLSLGWPGQPVDEMDVMQDQIEDLTQRVSHLEGHVPCPY